MADAVIDLSDANFPQEVLQSETPVLVDFSAVWCGPCKALYPTVAAIAGEYNGRLKVGKLDIDQNPQTAMKYHVRAVPTLMVFHKGQVVAQKVGGGNKRALESLFDKVL